MLDRGGSIKEGHFGFRHFVCEFYRRMDTVGMFEKFINLLCCILDVYLSFLFVCTELMFPIRHPVGSYVGYIFRCLYIYIYILYKRLEASDNHTIYLSHWISKCSKI